MNKKYVYVMGFMNYCSHDPGAAIVRYDGKEIDLITCEEGFLSRKKKSYHFPIRSINYCLDYFNIKLSDIDLYSIDFMDFKRDFRTSDNYRQLIGDYIRSQLKIEKSKIYYPESHHYAHALTAFYPSNFDNSAVLIVDGLGSNQQTHSVYLADKKNGVKKVFEQKGLGIGLLYSLITKSLGFEAGEEGKTMGLAPYGSKYSAQDKNLPSLRGKYYGLIADYSDQILRSPSPNLRIKIKQIKKKNDVYKPYYSRLAYNVQRETERFYKHIVKEIISKYGVKNLCLAGGVALNCVSNNKIQELGLVENLYIYPAAGDSGIPLGLALAGIERLGFSLNKIFAIQHNRDKLKNLYSTDIAPLSKMYEKNFMEILKKNKIKPLPFDANLLAENLLKNKVIALYSQGIEIGPRALGHRSFLADATSLKMKNVLNKKIKHREGYRPFAPIVIDNDFDLYFKSKTKDHSSMIRAPKCKQYAINTVPAVCHVDNTARVQTVNNVNGKVYLILCAYKKLTGVSVLINTSFNDNNEPIVFTKLDAFISFLNCNADLLVLEDIYIQRENIKNIQKLKIDLIQYRNQINRKYFVSSLTRLTNIDKRKTSNLNTFVNLNNSLTKFSRNNQILLRLINFLFSRDKAKQLIICDFHLIYLKKLFALIGRSITEMVPKFTIYPDNYETFIKTQLLTKPADVLLYNVSCYIHNDYLPKNENVNSFYRLNDLILSVDTLKLEKNYNSDINMILDSYEFREDRDINSFFSIREAK
jgi:carbamoyltransferase